MAASSVAELDPVFLKAIKLLHSRHPDSTEQLRMLRDEAIKQQSQPSSSHSNRDKTKDVKSSSAERRPTSVIIPISDTKPQARLKEPKIQTMEVSSTRIDPIGNIHPQTVGIEMVEELGSSVVETVEEMSSASLMGPSAPKKAKLQINVQSVIEQDLLKSPELPVEDLAIDLGVCCVMCRGHESKAVGNKLMECHECHSHFHQKCHEPKVSDQDANDLRLVWYCSVCIKKMRELSTSTTTKSRVTEPTPLPGRTMTATAQRPSVVQSFKRPSSSDTKSSFPSAPQSFAIPGLAGASGTSTTSKPSVAGSSSSSTQKSSMQSAMKRLQMVKKKAAQKILNHQQIRVPRR